MKLKSAKLIKMLIILHSSFFITTCPFGDCFSQWVQQTVPVNKPITGIEFVDTLHGWACTSRGTPADTGYILYTTNGGTNWLVQLSIYNFGFTDIDMLNALTGYAGGYDINIALSKLYKTTNGGVNWTSITMVPNMYIGDMQFLNKDSAWECGISFGPDVRTTTDGGNTWIVRTNGITQQVNRVFFLNYNTGFCGSFDLFKTTNAGVNWALIGSFGDEIFSLYFINYNTGWLGMSNNRIVFTSNGGANWINQATPFVSSQTILDICFINNMTGWAGRTSNIYKTIDGGSNWGYQLVSTGSNRITGIDALNCWTGYFGISHSTNGGGPIYYMGLNVLSNIIPNNFVLYQNYPNPFNPSTVIKFDVKTGTYVKLIIIDLLGREIEVLVNQRLNAGSYEYRWNGSDLPSGIYFYRLITQNYSETKKMTLLR